MNQIYLWTYTYTSPCTWIRTLMDGAVYTRSVSEYTVV